MPRSLGGFSIAMPWINNILQLLCPHANFFCTISQTHSGEIWKCEKNKKNVCLVSCFAECAALFWRRALIKLIMSNRSDAPLATICCIFSNCSWVDPAGKRTRPPALTADHCAINTHAGLHSLEHLNVLAVNRKTELLIKVRDLFFFKRWSVFRIDTLDTVDYTSEYIADMLRSSDIKKYMI